MSEEPIQAPAETPPTQPEPIPQDLQNQMGAIHALIQCHGLLSVGHFRYAEQVAVGRAIEFIRILHAETLEIAKKHPSAHLVPELSETVPAISTGAPNAQT